MTTGPAALFSPLTVPRMPLTWKGGLFPLGTPGASKVLGTKYITVHQEWPATQAWARLRGYWGTIPLTPGKVLDLCLWPSASCRRVWFLGSSLPAASLHGLHLAALAFHASAPTELHPGSGAQSSPSSWVTLHSRPETFHQIPAWSRSRLKADSGNHSLSATSSLYSPGSSCWQLPGPESS